MKLAFIFGKNWKLSLAEMLAYLDNRKIEWKFIDLTKKAFIIDTEAGPEIIHELGGILKIIGIEKEFPFAQFEKQDFGEDVEYLISTYGSYTLLHRIRKIFKRIPKDGVLSVRDKIKKKIEHENALIYGMKTCYYGSVIAYYNPYEHKKRDMSRPHTDYLTIAPSRAMILVNLSKAKKNMLDPFCGLGTIAQEAIMLGIKNIYISDIDKDIVKKAKRNLKWTQKEYGKISIHAKTMDARKMDYSGIEAIATEPYLGPALKEKPQRKDAKKIATFLETLYKPFFNSAYRILKPGARIAIALPVFNAYGRKIYVNKFYPGFRVVHPFNRIPKKYKEELKLTNPFIVDEEREKKKLRNVMREFCVYEVKK